MPGAAVAGVNTLVIVLFYLIAQMVGAGKLIQLLFGLPYFVAVGLVGVLMMVYVTFGGMLATTWVQIIKAVLLLTGSALMSCLILAAFRLQPGGAVQGRDRASTRRASPSWRRAAWSRTPSRPSRWAWR